MKRSPLRDKTMLLSEQVIRLVHFLTKQQSEYIFSKQLARSGTNPGAMLREANNAESRRDFIHKLHVAQKEVGETQYWLELLLRTNYIDQDQFKRIYPLTKEIMLMLRSSIITAKKKSEK
ncbi:MAG: four helix bundle protein [Bacteroidota bacterium]